MQEGERNLSHARAAEASHQAAATTLGVTDNIKSMKDLTKLSNIKSKIYFAATGRQKFKNKRK